MQGQVNECDQTNIRYELTDTKVNFRFNRRIYLQLRFNFMRFIYCTRVRKMAHIRAMNGGQFKGLCNLFVRTKD